MTGPSCHRHLPPPALLEQLPATELQEPTSVTCPTDDPQLHRDLSPQRRTQSIAHWPTLAPTISSRVSALPKPRNVLAICGGAKRRPSGSPCWAALLNAARLLWSFSRWGTHSVRASRKPYSEPPKPAGRAWRWADLMKYGRLLRCPPRSTREPLTSPVGSVASPA